MHSRFVCFAALQSAACLGLALSSLSFAPPADAGGAPAEGPRLVFATLIGGAAGDYDGANDLAVDGAENVYVAGTTGSSDFPTKNALQGMLRGTSDAFVAKFGPGGDLVFSTLLGGLGWDTATAIAVDAEGAVYVAGSTASADFPLENPVQARLGGSYDAFVAKIAPDGRSLDFSTYLGGNQGEDVKDIALDHAGRLYVAGMVSGGTASGVTFPLVNPVQDSYGGNYTDGFVAVVEPGSSEILLSTFLDWGLQSNLGRAGLDLITTLVVDPASGDFFVGGSTEIGPNEPDKALVARFRPGSQSAATDAKQRLGSSWGFLTVILSNSDDLEPPDAFAIKTVAAYMLGLQGLELPPRRKPPSGPVPELLLLAEGLCSTPPPATTCDEPAALATLDPDLGIRRVADVAALREFFYQIGATDAQGALYIAGDISSSRLTTVNPIQPAHGGRHDVVVAAFAPGSLEQAFVTFFGGDGDDFPLAIAVDPEGNIYVAGVTTLATTFPTTPGALQGTPKGRDDAFLMKISPVGPFPEEPDFALSTDPTNLTVVKGQSGRITVDVERTGGFAGNVTVSSPNAKSLKVKLTPAQASTTGASVTFDYKIKKKARPGTYDLTFTGKDGQNRERSATLSLTVQ